MRIELDGVVALLERGLEVAAVEVNHRDVARDDRRHRDRATARAMISSSASSSRPSGARHDAAYQWCAVAYRGLRLMARWNSRSAPAQSQSCVAFTCASDVCASAEKSSSMTAVVALDAAFVQTSAGPEHAVVRQQPVRVGQAAVRQRVLRVLAERRLEEVERLPQAFFGALIQVIAALQVQILRGQILGRPIATAAAAPRPPRSGSSFFATASRDQLLRRRSASSRDPSTDSDQR